MAEESKRTVNDDGSVTWTFDDDSQGIIDQFEASKAGRTAGDWQRVADAQDRAKATELYNAERQLRLAERGGASPDTIRSYRDNITRIKLQSDWGSAPSSPVVQKNTAYERAIARSVDMNLSGYERAMARDMAGLPNTSDPNVYYDQQSKTLRSTGGSPDYARGTFAGSSTTPQYALSTDPALPSGESAERRETWEKFFYDPNNLAYKPQSFVEAERKIGEETTKRLNIENMADQLGVDLDREYKQYEYIQQISDVSPMLSSQAPTIDPVSQAKQNLYSVKKQQELEKLEARLRGIDRELNAERARVEGMGHIASEANMMKYSSKYKWLSSKKEELTDRTGQIKTDILFAQQQMLTKGGDIVTETQSAFSGIPTGNPMEKVQTFVPVTSGYTDPTARDGTEGTIMDTNFSLLDYGKQLTEKNPFVIPEAYAVKQSAPDIKPDLEQVKPIPSMYDIVMDESKTKSGEMFTDVRGDEYGQFYTGSGWVNIKGLDPTSERGKKVQEIYAQQAQTRLVDNPIQTAYWADVTTGKVPLSKALWEPETTQAYKIDGKLQDTMPQQSIDNTLKYLQERGLDPDTPMGELRLTPTKYDVAREQAMMATPTQPMGMLPDTPDQPYLREGDWSGYISPEQRKRDMWSEAGKLPTMADFQVGGDARPEDWTIERASGTPMFSSDFNLYEWVGAGMPNIQQTQFAGMGADVYKQAQMSMPALFPMAYADDGKPKPPAPENMADWLWKEMQYSDRVDQGMAIDPKSTPTITDDVQYYMSTAMRPLYNIGKEVYNIGVPEEQALKVNQGAPAQFFGNLISDAEWRITGGKSGKLVDETMPETWDYIQKDPIRFASELPAEALLWWTGGKAISLATKLSPLKYGKVSWIEDVMSKDTPKGFTSTALTKTDDILLKISDEKQATKTGEQLSSLSGKKADPDEFMEYFGITKTAGIALTKEESIGLQAILGKMKGVKMKDLPEDKVKELKKVFQKADDKVAQTTQEGFPLSQTQLNEKVGEKLAKYLAKDDNKEWLMKTIDDGYKRTMAKNTKEQTTNFWRGFYLAGVGSQTKGQRILTGVYGGGRLGWGGAFARGNRPDLMQWQTKIVPALTKPLKEGDRPPAWTAGFGTGAEKELIYSKKSFDFLLKQGIIDEKSVARKEAWEELWEKMHMKDHLLGDHRGMIKETFKDLDPKEAEKILGFVSKAQGKKMVDTVHGSLALQPAMALETKTTFGALLKSGDVDLVALGKHIGLKRLDATEAQLDKIANLAKKELGDKFDNFRIIKEEGKRTIKVDDGKDANRKLIEIMTDTADNTGGIKSVGDKFIGREYFIDDYVKVAIRPDGKRYIKYKQRGYQFGTNLATTMGFVKAPTGSASQLAMYTTTGRSKDIVRAYVNAWDYAKQSADDVLLGKVEKTRKLYPELEKDFTSGSLTRDQIYDVSSRSAGIPEEFFGQMFKGAPALPLGQMLTPKQKGLMDTPVGAEIRFGSKPQTKKNYITTAWTNVDARNNWKITLNKKYWKDISDETGVPPVESKVTRVIEHEVMHNVLAKLHSPPSQAVFGGKTTQEWDVLAYGTKDNKITVKDYDDSKLKVTGRGVEYPKEYKYLTLEQRDQLNRLVWQSQFSKLTGTSGLTPFGTFTTPMGRDLDLSNFRGQQFLTPQQWAKMELREKLRDRKLEMKGVYTDPDDILKKAQSLAIKARDPDNPLYTPQSVLKQIEQKYNPSGKVSSKPSTSLFPSIKAPSNISSISKAMSKASSIPSSKPSSVRSSISRLSSSRPSMRSSKASSVRSSRTQSRPSRSGVSRPFGAIPPIWDYMDRRKKKKGQKVKKKGTKKVGWAVPDNPFDASGYLFKSGMEYRTGRRSTSGRR